MSEFDIVMFTSLALLLLALLLLNTRTNASARPFTTADDRIEAVQHNSRSWTITIYSGDEVRRYRGRSTVWHTFPDARRCNRDEEEALSSLELRAEWACEDHGIFSKPIVGDRVTIQEGSAGEHRADQAAPAVS